MKEDHTTNIDNAFLSGLKMKNVRDIIHEYFSDRMFFPYIERILVANASELADIYNDVVDASDEDIDRWTDYIRFLSEHERELLAHWTCVWRVSRGTPPVSRWPFGRR